MFTRILVKKAEINVFIYQDTERESCTLCHIASLQHKTRFQHMPVQGQ